VTISSSAGGKIVGIPITTPEVSIIPPRNANARIPLVCFFTIEKT
jgi:hypothetical protein